MNRLMIALALAAGAMFPALAQDKPVESTVQGDDPEALKLITDCNARKFETVVDREENGERKSSKVKLCGKQGQTDAEWAATLKDAAAKIDANDKMPQGAKDQLSAALKAEIAKVEAGAAPTAPGASVVPPAPPPLPAPSAVAAKTLQAAPVLKKPKLTIRCLSPGEKGGGSSCSVLDRATRLSILADAELASGASLRFLRRGDVRAQQPLTPMRQGETFRSKLPPELCAGVASTKVEIQVMSSGQVVETLGPFSLRC